MKVAYVISRYPAVSHTFITREILALRHAGITIERFSVRPPFPDHLITDTDKSEAQNTFVILPPRVAPLVGAHLVALFTRPSRYFLALYLSLRENSTGVTGLLWRFFYFLEAVILWRQCRKRGVKHLHAHFANVAADLASIAAFLGQKEGCSWSFTMHGPTEFADVAKFNLARKALSAKFIICISDFCRSQLMALVEPSHWPKMHIVHCGVDTSHFAPSASAAAKPAAAGAPVEILCVGRLVSVKGQAILLQALAELSQRGHNVHATFIGDGPDRPLLEQQARQLNIVPQVAFTGAIGQDKIRSYYTAADIFCLPSFAEGVPVVLMEAMGMGLPVVSTQIAGIPELVAHGVSGLLVSPGRADQLALALEHLAVDAELRRTLGQAARKKVMDEFQLSHCAEELTAIFHSALADVTTQTAAIKGANSSNAGSTNPLLPAAGRRPNQGAVP